MKRIQNVETYNVNSPITVSSDSILIPACINNTDDKNINLTSVISSITSYIKSNSSISDDNVKYNKD